MTASSILHAASPVPAAGLTRFSLVRILLGIVAVAVPVAGTMFLVHQLVEKSMRGFWPQLLAALLCVAGYCLYVRKVEKREVAELSGPKAAHELAGGVLLGAALFLAVIGIAFASGAYQIVGRNGWGVLLAPLTELMLVALFEETLFRGVLFRNVERSLGSWNAVLLSSLIFALAHLPNEGISVLGVTITAVAGMMFAAAYMWTRRLWLVIGMHFAWNFMSEAVFSASASGHAAKGIFQGRLQGPEWLSGGAYGVEASVITLVVLSAATAVLIVMARRRGHILPFGAKAAA